RGTVTLSVRGQYLAACATRQLVQDARRIVGGVDQEAFLALRIAEHVDVVVVGADREGGQAIHALQSTQELFRRSSRVRVRAMLTGCPISSRPSSIHASNSVSAKDPSESTT